VTVAGEARGLRATLTGLLLLICGAAHAGESVPLPDFFQETFEAVAASPLASIGGALPAAMRPSFDDLPSIITSGVPTPPARPVVTPGPIAYASVASDASPLSALPRVVPLPIRRPGGIEASLSEIDPAEAEPALPKTKIAMLGAMPGAGMAIAALARMEPLAPITKGSCSVGRPYKVTALGPSARTELTPTATLDYDMVQGLVKWEEGLQAIAKKTLGEPIVGLHVAASYDCRTMNHRRRAKLSEHAHANAIDISVFTTASGQTISVRRDFGAGGARGAFLKAVRAETCDVFQVVLGPGSDGMHEDHFHMDLGRWKACR
jgi:hypothetical protein